MQAGKPPKGSRKTRKAIKAVESSGQVESKTEPAAGEPDDWLAEANAAEKAQSREHRRSDRDHGFRGRTIDRGIAILKLVDLPNHTDKPKPRGDRDIARWLNAMETARRVLVRRRARIEKREQFAPWIARRTVRIAWSLHKYLESQRLPYVRPLAKGGCAAFSYDIIEAAASRVRHREVEATLTKRIESELGRVKEWRAHFAKRHDSFLNLVSDSLWSDVFNAIDSWLESSRLGVVKKRRAQKSKRQQGTFSQVDVSGAPTLTPQEIEMLRVFLDEPLPVCLTADTICEKAFNRCKEHGRMDASDFRSRIAPRLKLWGLKPEGRRGYSLPADALARLVLKSSG